MKTPFELYNWCSVNINSLSSPPFSSWSSFQTYKPVFHRVLMRVKWNKHFSAQHNCHSLANHDLLKWSNATVANTRYKLNSLLSKTKMVGTWLSEKDNAPLPKLLWMCPKSEWWKETRLQTWDIPSAFKAGNKNPGFAISIPEIKSTQFSEESHFWIGIGCLLKWSFRRQLVLHYKPWLSRDRILPAPAPCLVFPLKPSHPTTQMPFPLLSHSLLGR